MCGLAGIYSPPFFQIENYKKFLNNVGDTLFHRGPDDSGIWLDSHVGIGFVHRRLSIQDLSPLGKQPMVSNSGRYVVVFNGEIYNFKNISGELEKTGYTFKGHSDTEVMLAAFETYGVLKSLKLFSGMFAFAVYDRDTRKLTLARDRMGEKPLYYGWVNGNFVFASELKALQAFPFWNVEINRDALSLLVRHNFIPAPWSIFRGIYKLLPATSITFNLLKNKENDLPSPVKYWELSSQFNHSTHTPISLNDATKQLDQLLRDVINEQMISDVPLGTFLSGGIDSSTVAAIMQQESSIPVKTFSIGFEDKKYNEAIYAKAVAQHLGTDHTELYVTPEDALRVIPKLPLFYDEPFADSSQIPTYLVAEMTKRHVTVALSGDGGDELFCGYGRYFSTSTYWTNRFKNKNHFEFLVSMAVKFAPEILSTVVKNFKKSQHHLSRDEILAKFHRRQLLLSTNELNEYYRQVISYWNEPQKLVLGANELDYSMRKKPPLEVGESLFKQLMWQDLNCYLPDDILVKVDRAAMACSLETRVPLLDRRIVEFALGLPINMNLSGNQGKQVLRSVLNQYVPKHLIDREKAGFAIPVGCWMRNELRDWAESLLDQSRLSNEGFWNTKTVRRKWNDHVAKRGNHEFQLWGILMFQAWYEKNKSFSDYV